MPKREQRSNRRRTKLRKLDNKTLDFMQKVLNAKTGREKLIFCLLRQHTKGLWVEGKKLNKLVIELDDHEDAQSLYWFLYEHLQEIWKKEIDYFDAQPKNGNSSVDHVNILGQRLAELSWSNLNGTKTLLNFKEDSTEIEQ